jgi:hypothetical protein
MTRKRCNRRTVTPMLPKGLRPKLARDQIMDLAHVHIGNLDDMVKGRGTVDLLWQVTGGVLTWSRVAERMGQHVDDMRDQCELMNSVLQRWLATGRVVLTGPEYQRAKRGVEVMDQLALDVDRATAVEAAEWSEARVNALVEAVENGQAQKHAAQRPTEEVQHALL